MNIKVVFIANVLCHHQVYISDELYKKFGNNFSFIQMREPLKRRIILGMEGFERTYCVNYYNASKSISNNAKKILKEADVVIWGSVSFKYIKRFIRKKILLFRYSERIFKPDYKKCSLFGKIKLCLSFKHISHLIKKYDSYLLCASGFAYYDYLKFGAFRDRAYVWGYFPYLDKEVKTRTYYNNDVLKIVWCSRLIDWKHPEYMIYLSNYLAKNGIKHIINVVGDGPLRHIFENNQHIVMHGNVKTDKVREFYLNSDVAVFTSDFNEGWGVGVSEAMNNRCLVISSDAMGCAPYLLKDNFNSLIFCHSDINDLCKKVQLICNNKSIIARLANNGYETIDSCWRPEQAALRLTNFIKSVIGRENITTYKDGPLSKARAYSNDWYKNEK